MIVSEKRLAANRRNIKLAWEKSKEACHRIRKHNQEQVECTSVCEHCHSMFSKMIPRIDLENNRIPRFCSRSCANSRIRTSEIKNKIRAKLVDKRFVGGIAIELSPVRCKYCGKEIVDARSKHRVYCSTECRRNAMRHMKLGNFNGSYWQYRRACMFRFGLSNYPDEFDFKLIEQYGWYSPKNKKDNPNGVTRDHMFSVKRGFDNNVSPDLISHPANCMLMLHLDNVSKGKKCSLTLDELKTRISEWELKYGKYECK